MNSSTHALTKQWLIRYEYLFYAFNVNPIVFTSCRATWDCRTDSMSFTSPFVLKIGRISVFSLSLLSILFLKLEPSSSFEIQTIFARVDRYTRWNLTSSWTDSRPKVRLAFPSTFVDENQQTRCFITEGAARDLLLLSQDSIRLDAHDEYRSTSSYSCVDVAYESNLALISSLSIA